MISLLYRSFGRTPPTNLSGYRYATIWLAALAFVASSLLMLAVFNFFSLFFGVSVNFLGRNGVKFTFMHLFGRLPLIGIAPLVLLGYAVWQNIRLIGTWNVVVMPLVNALAAIALIAAIVAVNSLRARL